MLNDGSIPKDKVCGMSVLKDDFPDISNVNSAPFIKTEILDPYEENETFVLPDYPPVVSVLEPVIKTEIVCSSEQTPNLVWQNFTVEDAWQNVSSGTEEISLSNINQKKHNCIPSESKSSKCFVVLHDCLAPENLIFCSVSANFNPLKINKDKMKKRALCVKKARAKLPSVYFSPVFNKNEVLLDSKKTYSFNQSVHCNEVNEELSSIDLLPASEWLKMRSTEKQHGNCPELSKSQLSIYNKALHSLPESGKSVEHFMEEFYLNHPDFGKI